jgi:hypothetical protein
MNARSGNKPKTREVRAMSLLSKLGLCRSSTVTDLNGRLAAAVQERGTLRDRVAALNESLIGAIPAFLRMEQILSSVVGKVVFVGYDLEGNSAVYRRDRELEGRPVAQIAVSFGDLRITISDPAGVCDDDSVHFESNWEVGRSARECLQRYIAVVCAARLSMMPGSGERFDVSPVFSNLMEVHGVAAGSPNVLIAGQTVDEPEGSGVDGLGRMLNSSQGSGDANPVADRTD